MKLTGQLQSTYKSFESGFEFEFDGELIVISGVNGSGKSQLFDIIRQIKTPDNTPDLQVQLSLDGNEIGYSDVAYRSFKENINVPTFKKADPEIIKASNKQVINHYKKHRLNHRNKSVQEHTKSCIEAKAILIEAFGAEAFDKGSIADRLIEECSSLSKFIWRTDDIFENVISEVFFNFANQKLHMEAKAARERLSLNYDEIEPAPWTSLNQLFETFRFGYRFKDSYEIVEDGFSLNESPRLFELLADGSLDGNEPRELHDLSDGEKAIISLVFGSLSGVVEEHKKILLFDEFDATLNPSLTNIFYEILDDYFIKKGVMVLIATHSPTTISLASRQASFYEVFSKRKSCKRILPVNKDSYAELEIASKNFLETIADQTQRIQILEEQASVLENLLEDGELPVLYVEGPTDVSYIKHAYKIYGKEADLGKLSVEIIGEHTPNGTIHSNDAALKSARNFLITNPNQLSRKVILLHDPESAAGDEDCGEKLFVRKMPFNEAHPLKKGIENLFPVSLVNRIQNEHPEYFEFHTIGTEVGNLKIIGTKKVAACKWVCDNAVRQDFEIFEAIFTLVEELLLETR